MQFSFIKFNGKILAVIVVTALFLFSLNSGINHGKANAQAEAVQTLATQLQKGLDYFYSDQNRFPTAQEFSDQNLLLLYFSSIPDNTSTNSSCAQNFVYKRLAVNSYNLSFCLAANLGSYQKGWNQITVQK